MVNNPLRCDMMNKHMSASKYQQHKNDPTADTELESWPEDINGHVRVYGPTFRRMIPRNNVLTVVAMSIILSLCCGILIGYFGHTLHHPEDHCLNDMMIRLTSEAHDKIADDILKLINKDNIRNYHKSLTEKVHHAGSERQKYLAENIRKEWTNNGFDASLNTYNVMFSYPDINSQSGVYLLSPNGTVMWKTRTKESLTPNDDPNMLPPFNAYSPCGNITSEIVYANYGRFRDYNYLKSVLNIDLSGKIALVRYGSIFRGSKVYLASYFNMSGVILYSDPKDVAPYGVDSSQTYPNSWWMPATGVQRGSIFDITGDALTIGYPSNEYMYRELPIRGTLPSIPTYPISYSDAHVLLGALGGPNAPSAWIGKVPGVNYRVGPGFTAEKKDWKIRLQVNNRVERRNLYNVIGKVRGSVEPDRYIMLGNHRDAWTYGGTDPSSGTACLMEITRVFGLLLKSGWKPRRTIIFASWDGEEQSISGSTEYVEDYGKLLMSRAMAYLNVDIAVNGNYSLHIKSSPLLTQAAYDVAKMIPNPNPYEIAQGRKTVYDTWLYTSQLTRSKQSNSAVAAIKSDGNNWRLIEAEKLPIIGNLGSGSDFVAFLNLAGVTSLDVRYGFDKVSSGISQFPLYHTAFDTYLDSSQFIDPTYSYHCAVAQFWAEMGRYLSDSYVLPFSPKQYGISMQRHIHLLTHNYIHLMIRNNISLGILPQAITKFINAADIFHEKYNLVDDSNTDIKNNRGHNARVNPTNVKSNPLTIRALNDKLMQLERAFLDFKGNPIRPWYKHKLLAPSVFNFYNGTGFPGLTDLLYILSESEAKPTENEETNDAMSMFDPNAGINSAFTDILHDHIVWASAEYSSLNLPVLAGHAIYTGFPGIERLTYHNHHNQSVYETDFNFNINNNDNFYGSKERKYRKLQYLKQQDYNDNIQQLQDFENPKGVDELIADHLSKIAKYTQESYHVKRDDTHKRRKARQSSNTQQDSSIKNDSQSGTQTVLHSLHSNLLLGGGDHHDKSYVMRDLIIQSIKKEISVIIFTIESATRILTEDLY